MWGMSIFDPRYVPAPDGTLFLRRKPLPQSGDHQMGLAFALRQTRIDYPKLKYYLLNGDKEARRKSAH